MPKIPLTEAALTYFAGEAAVKLEDLYRDDQTPEGTAFRDRLKFTINTYCQDHANAGAQIASFVEDIPFPKEWSVDDALLARHVLLETQAALQELLQDDEAFLDSYRGDTVPSDDVDQSVRRDAREFDKRYKLDKGEVIRRSAEEGAATDDEVTNSFYDGKDGVRTESDVAHSSRDQGHPETSASEPKRLQPPSEPEDFSAKPKSGMSPRADSHPPQSPKSIDLSAPDYLGVSPSMVFNMAKKWLTEHIIQVASGSAEDGKFPRLQPLTELPDGLSHRLASADVRAIIADIRSATAKLKPPLVESFDHLLDIAERLRKGPKGSPDNLGDAVDALNDALGAFKDMFGDPDEDKYDLGTNDWKKGGGLDADE